MPHVLIADNDGAVSALLTEVLVRTGLKVEHAFDGEQARQMARHPGVGLVVCDLDMPRLSGVEVLESLVDLPRPPAAVVISGYLDERIRARLAQLPFVRETMRKPFDLLAFSSRVHGLLASAPTAAAEH